MNSLEVIFEVLRGAPLIDYLSFHTFPEMKPVQESEPDWNEEERHMFVRALEFKKMGMSFWDGIMLSTFNNPGYSERLLHQALRHNTHPLLTFVAKDNLSVWLEDHTRSIDTIALCSKVIMASGEELHLPLIDFHIPFFETNVRVVVSVCSMLGLYDGWILNSGESYHFIGAKPMCYTDLEQLLCKALMYTPIIDKAWISHQLREHSCSLRIGRKRGVYPIVVKKLKE